MFCYGGMGIGKAEWGFCNESETTPFFLEVGVQITVGKLEGWVLRSLV